MSAIPSSAQYDIGVLIGLAEQNGISKKPSDTTANVIQWNKIADHYKLLVPKDDSVSSKELEEFYYSIVNCKKVNAEDQPKVIQVNRKANPPSVKNICQVQCPEKHWVSVLEDFQQKFMSPDSPFAIDGGGANVFLCGEKGFKVACHEVVVRKFTKLFDSFESCAEVRDPYDRFVFILAGFDQKTLKALIEILYTGQTLMDTPDCVEDLRKLLADDIHFVASVTTKLASNFEHDIRDQSVYRSDLMDLYGTDYLCNDSYDNCHSSATRTDEEGCDKIDEQEGTAVDKDAQTPLGYNVSHASDTALNIPTSADNTYQEEIIFPDNLSKGSIFKNMDEAIKMFSKFCKQNFYHWKTRSSHKDHTKSFKNHVHLTCIHFGTSDRQNIPLFKKFEKKQCPFEIKINVPKGGIQAIVTKFINKHQNHDSGMEYYQSIPVTKRLTYNEIVQIGPKVLDRNLDPDSVLAFIKEKTSQELTTEDLHKIRRRLEHKIANGKREPSIVIPRQFGIKVHNMKEADFSHVSEFSLGLAPNMEQTNNTESDEDDMFDMSKSPSASKLEEKSDKTNMENNHCYPHQDFMGKYDRTLNQKTCDSESNAPVSSVKYDEEGKISSDTFKKGSKFKDIKEATELFSKFCQQHFYHWKTRDSKKNNDPNCTNFGQLRWAQFTCIHSGTTVSRGRGLRKRNPDKLKRQCPFEIKFLVVKGGKYAIVTGFVNEHRNHDVGEEYYRSSGIYKRLTDDDIVQIGAKILTSKDTKSILAYVKEKTGKGITSKDLQNARRRLENMMANEEPNQTEVLCGEEAMTDVNGSPFPNLEGEVRDKTDLDNKQDIPEEKDVIDKPFSNEFTKSVASELKFNNSISSISDPSKETIISSAMFTEGSTFKDIEEATDIFSQFCRQNFFHWKIRDSRKNTDPNSKNFGKLRGVQFTCIHSGTTVSKGTGLRKSNPDKLRKQCPFSIKILVQKGSDFAIVTEFVNEHQNHGSGEEYYKSFRKLTDDELKLVGHKILEPSWNASDSRAVLEFIKEKTGKQLKLKDLVNIRTSNRLLRMNES